MKITLVEWVLVALTTCRLTWLVINDKITEPIRERIIRKAGRRQDKGIAYLITCPWCTSVWIAPLVVGWAYVFGDGWSEVPLGVASASFVAAVVVGVIEGD